MIYIVAINVDTERIVNTAVFDVGSSEHQLQQHCTTSTHRRRSINPSNNVSNYQPVVRVVVPAPVMNVLPRLYDCQQKDSHVFRAICKDQIELVSIKVEESRVCPAVFAAREIWLPVLNTWDRLRNGLEDGSITGDDIYSYFARLADSEVNLREELCKLSKTDRVPRWLGERVQQIQDLLHLRSSLELASILIELIEVLGLSQTKISDIGRLEDLVSLTLRVMFAVCVLLWK